MLVKDFILMLNVKFGTIRLRHPFTLPVGNPKLPSAGYLLVGIVFYRNHPYIRFGFS